MQNCLIIRHSLYKALLATLVLSIAFPAPIFAARIKILKNTNIHNDRGNKTLKRETTLLAGTIVEVPNEYLENLRHGEDPQKALIRWLRQGVNLYRYTNSSGSTSQEYFSRVKIVSVPNQYQKEFVGKEFYMSLHALASLKDGLSFQVRQDTDALSFAQSEPTRQQASSVTTSEANCSTCQVLDPTPTIPMSLEKIKGLTKDLLDQAEEIGSTYVASKNINQVIAKFGETCKGLTFSGYRDFLKSEATKANIPLEVMLGIMTQESSGNCMAIDKSNANLGAFQINIGSKSADIEVCTTDQRAKLAFASLEEMKSNTQLKCLENPVVNAREGIRIYLEKFKSVNQTSPVPIKQWGQYTSKERDDIRRAIAGYNGGQAHVIRALSDMEKFRIQYAPDLDSNSFELQKIFFFRELLKQEKLVDQTLSARTNRRSIENLAYTESITGRETEDSKVSNGLISAWEALLYRNPVPVAQKQ